jgi:hypothetical protein
MAETDEQALQRAWLRRVMQITGLKATPLAKRAGLSPSTLLRALDNENPTLLDTRSINKIVDKCGVAGPETYAHRGQEPGPGFAESGLEIISDEENELFAGAPMTPTQGRWHVRTRLLELAGCLPGDDLLADSAVSPERDDIVVAREVTENGPEMILRVYDPPYLLTATIDRDERKKPLLVDHSRVSIWGTVVKVLRTRDR